MSIPAVAQPLRSASHPATPAPRASLESARVLIAEDNPVNMQVTSFHVEELGCIAGIAFNGRIAVDLFRHQPFEFVLMDCQMPVMDGFAALRAIRAIEATAAGARSTVIAVTAADDRDSRMQCAAAGFDGFLAKPFSAGQLSAVLLDCRGSLAAAERAPDMAAAAGPDNTAAAAATIDRNAFAAFVADFGAETASSLLASFVKLLHETETRFESACSVHDSAALQALAHKVAGASGTVGAIALARSARTVEAACKRGQLHWTTDIAFLGDAVVAAAADFERLLCPQALASFVATTSLAKPPTA